MVTESLLESSAYAGKSSVTFRPFVGLDPMFSIEKIEGEVVAQGKEKRLDRFFDQKEGEATNCNVTRSLVLLDL
jgi:hypothetical protein